MRRATKAESSRNRNLALLAAGVAVAGTALAVLVAVLQPPVGAPQQAQRAGASHPVPAAPAPAPALTEAPREGSAAAGEPVFQPWARLALEPPLMTGALEAVGRAGAGGAEGPERAWDRTPGPAGGEAGWLRSWLAADEAPGATWPRSLRWAGEAAAWLFPARGLGLFWPRPREGWQLPLPTAMARGMGVGLGVQFRWTF